MQTTVGRLHIMRLDGAQLTTWMRDYRTGRSRMETEPVHGTSLFDDWSSCSVHVLLDNNALLIVTPEAWGFTTRTDSIHF